LNTGKWLLIDDTEICIINGMKTTLNLRDDLIARAKAVATRESTTLTKLIEEGLTLRLRRQRSSHKAELAELPRSRRSGGFRSGIDASSNRSLFEAADL
jgi:hypothetical protein